MELIETGAKFSKCRIYRYALWRVWDKSLPFVMFIGLNPSTADETKNDPTIKRCIGFAKDWGYGGVYVVNLFAFRATLPKEMKLADKPIGPRNMSWLTKTSEKCDMIVGAWGNDGDHLNQSAAVISAFPKMHCLNINKSGHPAHPLYQKASVKPKVLIED